MKKNIIATIISTAFLFMWNGFVQVLPWGVPTTQSINAQSSNAIDTKDMKGITNLPANALTTSQFDEQCTNKISTLITDKSFSWIITKPTSYYNMGSYFMKEALTQLLVSIFLVLILFNTKTLSLKKRLSIIAFAAFAATIATYSQQINWWGLPLSYGLGVAVNLILGWLITSFIITKWFIKSDELLL
jgi:hypothetical protein